MLLLHHSPAAHMLAPQHASPDLSPGHPPAADNGVRLLLTFGFAVFMGTL